MNFSLTHEDDINPDVDVTYHTRNVWSIHEKRFIFFICDVPHLIRIAQNCLYNSGSGKGTRYMWNNGDYLTWNRISDLFYGDGKFGLHIFLKLSCEHIRLTSYFVMNVKLAAQVLWSTVSKVNAY